MVYWNDKSLEVHWYNVFRKYEQAKILSWSVSVRGTHSSFRPLKKSPYQNPRFFQLSLLEVFKRIMYRFYISSLTELIFCFIEGTLSGKIRYVKFVVLLYLQRLLQSVRCKYITAPWSAETQTTALYKKSHHTNTHARARTNTQIKFLYIWDKAYDWTNETAWIIKRFVALSRERIFVSTKQTYVSRVYTVKDEKFVATDSAYYIYYFVD